MKLIKPFLLGCLFLMPLLGIYKGFGFEQIKVLFLLVSVTLLGFIWMGKGIKWTKIKTVSGLFILILLLTSLTGTDPKISFLGREPYFQGWILYAYLYLFFLMVNWTGIKLKNWAIVLAGSATIVSLLATRDWVLLNILGTHVVTYSGRVVSTFGQPNFYAGFLLLTLPFAYYLRPIGLIGGFISIIGIFVSYSRLAILLALVLLILGLIDQLRAKFKITALIFAVILAALAIGLAFSSGIAGNEFTKPLKTYDPDLTSQSVEKRVYIWPVVWQLFLQRPVLGYGLENINESLADYFETKKHSLFEENLDISPVLISLKDLNIDRAHNYILDLFLFSGILGAGAWIVFVAFLIKRVKHKILLVSIITYLIWIQFQNQSVVQLLYFWLLAGLIDQESLTKKRAICL